FLWAADPVGLGLVDSLARPGGHVTGLSNLLGGISAKQLELLREVLPEASRIAVLWNPANSGNDRQWRNLQDAAPVLAIHLQSLEARSPADLDGILRAGKLEQVDALFVVSEPTVLFPSSPAVAKLADFATANRLASVGQARGFAESGFL